MNWKEMGLKVLGGAGSTFLTAYVGSVQLNPTAPQRVHLAYGGAAALSYLSGLLVTRPTLNKAAGNGAS